MGLLYPLAIQGSGSTDVEAFSSYLIRLACAHGTSVGTLLDVAFAHYPSKLLQSHRSFQACKASVLVRPNRTTDAAVDVISKATGVSRSAFDRTTFLCLIELLGRGMHMYSPRLRWCPACFAEFHTLGQPVYFKLRWQILDQNFCDIHRVRLHDYCGECNSVQDSFGYRENIRLCSRCSEPLDRFTWNDLTDQHPCVAGRDLVAYAAHHGDIRLRAGGPQRLLKRLADETCKFDETDCLARILRKAKYRRWAAGGEAMTLQTAMRMANELHLPLLSFLRGELNGTNRELGFDRHGDIPTDASVYPSRRRIQPAKLRRDIRNAYKTISASDKPSLAQLAKKIGVSAGALRYHFPEQVKEIVRRFSKARVDHQERVRADAKAAVREKIKLQSREPTISPGTKELLRQLRAETGLPKNVLRAEIRRELTSGAYMGPGLQNANDTGPMDPTTDRVRAPTHPN